MKLGSSSLFRRRAGDEHYKKLKLYGFDYTDYAISGALDGKTEEEYKQMILREKQLADEAGIIIGQVHGPWIYPPRDDTPEHRAERLADMQRSIRMTGMIGCKYWVIHPIMPFGAHAEPDTEEFWRLNEEFWRALLPTAKENDVVICLENMPMKMLSISKPDKTLEMVRRINDDNFKFCLDTGHASLRGFDPVEAVRLAGSDLKALHIHDNDGDSDQHLPPFYGNTNWKEFIKALDEVGFDGVFSLELGMPYHMPDRAYDLLVQVICTSLEELFGRKIMRF